MNYFSVGEEVILQSVRQPALNGEYVVEEIVPNNSPITCRITGLPAVYSGSSDGYRLSGLIAEKVFGRGEAIWAQSALRKKNKPSGRSFEQTIKSLSLSGVSS